MSFKKKMRIVGNQTISQYADNPYLINKENNKKRIPLWAKISIPSSLVAIGAVAAIVLANSLGNKIDISPKRINQSNKVFNSGRINPNQDFVQSIKSFSSDYFINSNRYLYKDGGNSQRDEENGNVIFSPIALTNQLYMLLDATKDNVTKEEIRHVLHFDGNVDYLEENQKIILNNAIDNDNCYSEISTGLFLKPSIAKYLKQEYINILSDYYYADIFEESDDWKIAQKQLLDYFVSKNAARLELEQGEPIEVTDDISEQEIIFAPTSNEINLTPCVHLESFWNVRFEKKLSPMTFANKNGTINDAVSQMKASFVGNVLETQNYYLVKIPLNSYSFNILLSKDNDEKLPHEHIDDLLSFAHEEEYLANIDISMPLFHFENFYTADIVLSYLGIASPYFRFELNSAFDDSGERQHFHNPSLTVSGTINVNENGLFSYSRTYSSYIEEPASTKENNYPFVNLIADHPFIYSITDASELPLFIGQVCNL